MQLFEQHYADLVQKILTTGKVRETRNGLTIGTFGEHLKIPVGKSMFPLIQGRKMFPKGILGELAAMLRKPTKLADFEQWGCNYWKLWAKEDGSISVDYGNAWHANGQIEYLKDTLANNPTDRRMIINGWRPEMLATLDLPCCHLLYQFYVRDGKYLDMLWFQRSVDMLIGLPSDIAFAAAWLIAIAEEFNLIPGEITMSLGDCHIYEEHVLKAKQYIEACKNTVMPGVYYKYEGVGDFLKFEPGFLSLDYTSNPAIQFKLKA